MLVLTRKKEEKLVIGDDITLTILKIKGNSIQIGVEAPRHVKVLRSELTVQDATEQQSAKLPAKSVCTGPGANRLRQLAGQLSEERLSTSAVQLV